MSTHQKLRPLYVQVDPRDTVAIIVNQGGLPACTQFDSGLTLLEDVPEAHKVALPGVMHDVIAERVIGVAMIFIGTIMHGYGDLLVKWMA